MSDGKELQRRIRMATRYGYCKKWTLSHLIKTSGDQLRTCYIDQLKEVDGTLAEHPSEQLQVTRKHNRLDNL